MLLGRLFDLPVEGAGEVVQDQQVRAVRGHAHGRRLDLLPPRRAMRHLLLLGPGLR
jgi:hypothetical protein